MWGPKGISDFKVFFFAANEGITSNNPKTAATKRTKGIDCQPNNNQIPAMSLASPRPIPSIFLKAL